MRRGNVFLRPFRAYVIGAFPHGLRRGLHSCAALRLMRIPDAFEPSAYLLSVLFESTQMRTDSSSLATVTSVMSPIFSSALMAAEMLS